MGSIINPAETNNIIAIKPTVGLVSRDAVIPVSRKHDSMGPIIRLIKDYTKFCQTSNLDSVRIGVPGKAPYQLKDTNATIVKTEHSGVEEHIALSTKERLYSQMTHPENQNQICSMKNLYDYIRF